MANKPRNGFIEVRFNIDQSQAFANIYPPEDKGEPITLEECLQSLRSMGASHGFREGALTDAIAKASTANAPVMNIVAAQGELVHNGEDAQIRYLVPRELVMKPLPRRTDGSNIVDWFALDPAKMVKEGDEVAAIVPATLGSHGRTITWPIQLVQAQPGRTAKLFAGNGVRASQDGLRLYAVHDGYLYQVGEQLFVVGLNIYEELQQNFDLNLPAGAILKDGAINGTLHAEGIIAIQGGCLQTEIRSQGDVFVEHAENCRIIAGGNIYVTQGLKNCTVITPHRVIAVQETVIAGGKLSATEGIEAWTLGSEARDTTEVSVGVDHFLLLRTEEIEKEISEAEANKERIRQAIKPFQTVSANAAMSDQRRLVLQRLQFQAHSQEQHINALHNERRQMQFQGKQKVSGTISVKNTLHPGVLIRGPKAQTFVSTPLQSVRLTGNSESGDFLTETLAAA